MRCVDKNLHISYYGTSQWKLPRKIILVLLKHFSVITLICKQNVLSIHITHIACCYKISFHKNSPFTKTFCFLFSVSLFLWLDYMKLFVRFIGLSSDFFYFVIAGFPCNIMWSAFALQVSTSNVLSHNSKAKKLHSTDKNNYTDGGCPALHRISHNKLANHNKNNGNHRKTGTDNSKPGRQI